ncbi:MAG: ATP synthase F0 subunit B [Pseudomonadota bacterium]|nr:ATP synthase F0 subunit B [Pseudomonadota bacterium]
MDILLGVLDQLKINNTIWIQLICFLVTYFFISNLFIKPYYRAYISRQDRTVGNQAQAIKTSEDAEAQYLKYQDQARAINLEIKNIFDKSRKDAIREQDHLIAGARAEGQKKIELGRTQIATESTRALQEAQKEVSDISHIIRAKMLGKETTN